MKNHGYPNMRANVGLVLAFDPVTASTVIAISSTVAAGAAVAGGVMNYMASQDAAAHARDLEAQQADQLKRQSEAAATQAAAQAVTGQTFGEDPNAKGVATGLGFHSDSGAPAGGRAALTGMN